MNPLHTLLSTLVLLIGTILQPLPAQQPAQQQTDQQRLVAALNGFAADLHGELAAAGDGPTCSPASISFALLMLLPGARGETASEIATMLHLPADLRGDRLHAAAAELLKQTAKGLELRITNDFWGQTGTEFVPDYLDLVKRKFGSDLHAVDFENDCERARKTINARIADATNQRIRELIPAGMITPATRAVISNAIWYRGKWVHEFYRPRNLSKFHVTPDRTVDASMMHVQEDFWYAETDAWQAVELPMQDRAIAFEIMLPREGVSLAEAERALLRGEHRKNRKAALVQVSMPAFRVRSAHRLRDPLDALGMHHAFTNRADFTGIDSKHPIQIDDAMHGTWINVDENGVEAAAATALTLEAGAAIREEPRVFRADRPFAFTLYDRRTGLLLFVGRVTDPTVDT